MRITHIFFLPAVFSLFILALGCGSDEPVIPKPPGDPQMLIAHNQYRALVGVAGLEWSEDLAAKAIALLEASTCMITNNSEGLGQNSMLAQESFSMEEITDVWASNLEFYDYENDSCTTLTGNCDSYKQIVWANSKTLGCAKASCFNTNGFAIWVCLYDPLGNIPGERPY